jgi:predicted phosphodiesterase
MRFDLVSDLHVEFWPRPFKLAQRRPKVLVVAGDVSDDPAVSVQVLRDLARSYKSVLFVDGNHESYQHATSPSRTRASITHELSKLPASARSRIHYLPVDGPFVSSTGVAFIGRNGWWRGGGSAERAMASKEASELLGEAITLSARNDVTRIVSVTHTSPHPDVVVIGGYLPGEQHRELYCNSALAPLRSIPKVGLCVFGHNHTPLETHIGNCKYICHPRGRPGNYPRDRPYAPLTVTPPP